MPYGTVNADTLVTSTSGGVIGAGNASLLKNRLINGNMVIDQRNAGASVTPTTATSTYVVDRWFMASSVGSKVSLQQTTTAPTGFSYSFKATSLAATSLSSTDYYEIYQPIEGYNIADLGWGTANAKTVTLSFWVNSSLTGTFGGSILSGGVDYTYPFTYTISAANTWEQKTVTIAGSTSGTFGTTNGVGFYVGLSLGAGSSVSGTAGSWQSGFLRSATGATSVVGTNGATFYITGVQLEVGSSATGFEYVNYQTSLANCQRYYEKSFDTTTAPANGLGTNGRLVGAFTAGDLYACGSPFKVTKRATPTITAYGSSQGSSGNGQWDYFTGSAWNYNTVVFSDTNTNGFEGRIGSPSGLTANNCYMVSGNWTASAEL
jgi:hypothetical protein